MKRIRTEIRTGKGMSQGDICRKLGVEGAYMGNVEQVDLEELKKSILNKAFEGEL